MAKVKISDELFEKVKRYSEIAGYSSIEEFVQHALEKEVAQLDEAGDDEDAVKKKLQGLGYL
jgi:metal-responsive CopG/Arc/MetJ family transcriptional regulator